MAQPVVSTFDTHNYRLAQQFFIKI